MSILAGIVFLSFLVEAATGFGSMVVALTLGALWFTVPELLGWLIPVNMVLSAYLVTRGRRDVQWRFLGTRMIPLMAVGLGVGTLVAAKANEASWLKAVFGVFVIGVAAWQLKTALRPSGDARPLPGPARVAALFGAGVIHGIFATGGPLAVFVSARELPEKAAFRATLSTLWLALNTLVLPRLVLEGQVTVTTLQTSALMLLSLGAGIAAGEWIHHRIAEGGFRIAVAGLLLAAGCVLTVNSLRPPGLSEPVEDGPPQKVLG
ncbi:MAG TPA: sulfite exporter TauE/SafE family protein [Archangium sp.]